MTAARVSLSRTSTRLVVCFIFCVVFTVTNYSYSQALASRIVRPAPPSLPPDAAPDPMPPTANGTHSPFYDARLKFEAMLQVNLLKVVVEQSSNVFRDFHEKRALSVEVPTPPSDPGAENMCRACDPTDAVFTLTRDETCMAYLSDMRNVHSLRPMSSILSTGRTIKFRVFYKHCGRLEVVMKVSQTKFVLEPASEICAFVVDRAVGFLRVPPTVWQSFPLDWLRAASTLHGAFYCQWFHKFVVLNPSVQTLTHTCRFGFPGKCVNVSLQVFMANVTDALDTPVAPPPRMSTLTNPSRAIPDGVPWATRSLAFNASVVELTNMYVFDWVIANTDRSYGHNHFAYTDKLMYVYLDQGSSFYRKKGPKDMNPLGNTTGYCRHTPKMVASLARLTKIGRADKVAPLVDAIKHNLPKGIQHLVAKSNIISAQERLDQIHQHVETCRQLHGDAQVLFFS